MNRYKFRVFGWEKEFVNEESGCTCAFFILFAISAIFTFALIAAVIYALYAVAQWLLAAV